jgi:uncharacterized protein YacL
MRGRLHDILCGVDVERTIEFLLQAQAKSEVRIDALTKLAQRAMRMLVTTNTRLAEVARVQKEMAQAQRELVRAQKRTDTRLEELARAQTATERSLKALIDSRRMSRNGR